MDSYRPRERYYGRDTARRSRSPERRRRQHSSPRWRHPFSPRDRSRSPPRARRRYESPHYRHSPEERRRREPRDDPRYVPRPRSPREVDSRRERSRRSRSRSPVRARETDRYREGTRRQSRSRSPRRRRESRPATGSHSQASLGNPPTGKVKTKWIDKHRRAGLRSGKLLPQDDQERQWVEWQRRAHDVDTGLVEPANAREADVMRQHRMAGFVMAPQENKSIDESAQATQPEKPVSLDNEPILIPSDIHLSSPAGKQTSPLVLPEGHSDSGIAPPSCQDGAIQPQAGSSHAEEDWHASQQESPDPCLLEQMDLEMAQQLDYELNHVTPVPKPSVQNSAAADREWDNFRKRRQRMEQLVEAHTTPFAPVLAKFIRHFEEKCREQAISNGTVARPLNYSPPIMDDYISLKIEDILSLETPETCNDPTLANPWLTDTIVDFMVSHMRKCYKPSDRKHYVAESTPLAYWISDIEFLTATADRHVQNPEQEEAFVFPLADMPADTESISLIYNVNESHWVHILLQVDHEKKEGTIILHDSMGASRNREPGANGKTPPKGSTLATVESQLPPLARLISKRPSLQWGDVQWNSAVTTAPCPQQTNGSDCGVFAILRATQVASCAPVDNETSTSDPAKGPDCRWAILSVVHKVYFGQPLPYSTEAWLGYNDFEPFLYVDDDVQAASEPAGGAEGHETPMPTRSPSPVPDGDDASDSGASIDDDGPGSDIEGGSRKATRKRLGLVRAKMEKSIRELGVYPSQVCGTLRQDQANEGLMTDRIAICDLFRRERRSLTINEIYAGVSDRLHPMPIPTLPRLTALLESTPHSFSQDPSDGTWSLRDGAGRSIDSDSLGHILNPVHSNMSSLPDDIRIDYRLKIAFGRRSAASQKRGSFETMENYLRALIEHHHYRFSTRSALPRAIALPEEVRSGLQCPEGCSFVFASEARSSRCVFLFEKDDQLVRDVLLEADTFARMHNNRIKVLLLGFGIDCMSTNHRSWRRLLERWPNLDFHITLAIPLDLPLGDDLHLGNGFVSPYSRQEDLSFRKFSWLHLEAVKLAGLFDGRLTIDEILRMLSNTGDESRLPYLKGFNESGYVDDLRRHVAVLQLLALMNHYKIDSSIFCRFDPRSLHTVQQYFNRRNNIDLQSTRRICEIADCPSTKAPHISWARGTSSDVAVRCNQHTDEAVVAKSSSKYIKCTHCGHNKPATDFIGQTGKENQNCRTCSLKSGMEGKLKYCTRCGNNRPATDFIGKTGSKEVTRCQGCRDVTAKSLMERKSRRPEPETAAPGFKYCTQCGHSRPATDFIGKTGNKVQTCQGCRGVTTKSSIKMKGRETAAPGLKRCIRCLKERPATDFIAKTGREVQTCQGCRDKNNANRGKREGPSSKAGK